jgi:hypothetical protein
MQDDPYSALLGPTDVRRNRVAVIGNSHIAAFKAGWDLIRSTRSKHEMTFFGATRSQLRSLKVNAGALQTKNEDLKKYLAWTSGGLDHIPLDYDAYIVVGAELSFPHTVRLLETHRPPSFYDSASGLHLISDAAFAASISGMIENSSAMKVVSNIRKKSQAPVVLAPCPFFTKATLVARPYWNEKAAVDMVFGFWGKSLDAFKKIAIVDDQPTETIEDRFFTKADFAKNSIKIKPGHEVIRPVDDDHHMNGEFGARWINQILNKHLRTRGPS